MLYLWVAGDSRHVEQLASRTLLGSGIQLAVIGPGSTLEECAPGSVVLGFGTRIASRLPEFGLAPPKATIGQLRGKRLESPGTAAVVMMTHDFGLTWLKASAVSEIEWDIRLAARLHETGSLRPKLGEYSWAHDLSGLIAEVEAKFAETGKRVPVATDRETMGLFPWYKDKHIVTSQWTCRAGHAVVIDHRKYMAEAKPGLTPLLEAQIRWLYTSPKVKIWGANLKFDLQWDFEKWGLACETFTLDTVLAGSLLDENRRNSLKAHARLLTNMGGYEEDVAHLDKEHMELWPDHELMTYGAADADATIRCGPPIIRQLMRDPQLANFYEKLLHPAARVFEKIEARGELVDQAKFAELRVDLGKAIKEGTTLAMRMIPMGLKAKYADNLKLSRAALLSDFLFTRQGLGLKPTVFCEKAVTKEGLPKPSTSVKDHLGQFRTHPKAGPFILLLEAVNSAEKTRSTFVDGFLAHLRPDGRFHPSYALHFGSLFDDDDDEAGTNTGRLSAKNPARQTLPKHTKWAKQLRRCYIAPPGMLCWEMDFSQGELRVAACLANEVNMIAAYLAGIDLHAKTAARTKGVELEEFLAWGKCPEGSEEHEMYEALRQGGKAGNFGLLYRMSAKGFMEYAWKQYGVLMTLEEAEAFREAFFDAYPGLLVWHDTYVRMARRQGYVRSPLGRVRHLPLINSPDNEMRNKAERQAINSPVQGTLSDLNLFAAVQIDREFGESPEFYTIGSTHDSANGYVKEGMEEEYLFRAARLVNRMDIRGTFGWNHQLPFPVDVKVGPNLADMKKLALPA